MSAFADQKLTWAGKEYVIPARKLLGAIARVEEVITLRELIGFLGAGQFPLAKISQAYGAVLRYAGADLADEEIYEGMFADGSAQVATALAMQGLMEMMIPPSVRARANGNASAPVLAKGEADPMQGNSSATATPSSKPISKSRSRKAGAAH
jgi:hypothetical protein